MEGTNTLDSNLVENRLGFREDTDRRFLQKPNLNEITWTRNHVTLCFTLKALCRSSLFQCVL